MSLAGEAVKLEAVKRLADEVQRMVFAASAPSDVLKALTNTQGEKQHD